jgi:nicotinamide-nucleotide amidase
VNREVPSDRELELLSIRAGQALLGRGEVVTLAESCTGGYVAKLITDLPGSSRWFHSGFVTYSDMAKHRQLGVSQTTLAKEGAVSERGALAVSGAHRAIAITGIAGPDGGSDAKPVGLVWFARAVRIEEGSVGAVGLQRRFNGDRDAVRRQAAAYALELLFDP